MSIWQPPNRKFQNPFDRLVRKKRPVLQSMAMNKPLQWPSGPLWHSLRIWCLPLYPPDHPKPQRLTSSKTVLAELRGPRCGASSASPVYAQTMLTNCICKSLIGQFSMELLWRYFGKVWLEDRPPPKLTWKLVSFQPGFFANILTRAWQGIEVVSIVSTA